MKIINIFLILTIFLLLILGFLHPISALTQDLGRHLLTGEIIWETKTIPLTNLYSYTYPDFPFINHHWLSEVIYYFIHSLTGFNGLLIFTILIVVLAFSLVFFFSLGQKSSMAMLTIVSLLYLGILFERTDVRPEIFSFLFLSLFIAILYKNRQRFTKWIFLLPLLEFLWVNMHIYFIVGIAVIGLFLLDSFITHRNNLYCRYIGILVIILTASITFVLLNPNGLSGALYPFRAFQNYGYSIEENQNIFFLWSYFQKPTIVFFIIAIVVLFSTLLINLKKTKPVDWLLTISFTILGTVAIRNFPLFVFATFIPLTENLSTLLSRVVIPAKAGIHNDSGFLIKSGMTMAFILFLIITLWQVISVFSTRPIGLGIEKGAENAVNFYIKEDLKGPIFNNFDIGSYLEYRLYPKEKIFVDGRPEAYPSEFFQKTYIPMQQNLDIFKQVAFRYNFNSIFFTHNDQTPWAQAFLKQIIQDDSWKMIYLDDYVVIFVKDNAQNKKIINKYFVTNSNFQLTDVQKTNMFSLYRLANFFNTINWVNQQENIYQTILTINPNSCPALYNLAQLLSRKQSPLSSVFIQRFSLNCK